MGCNLLMQNNQLANPDDYELSDEVSSTLHKRKFSEITTILEDYSTFIKYSDQAFLPNFLPLNYLVRLFKKGNKLLESDCCPSLLPPKALD